MTITEYQGLAQRTASTKTAEDKIGHGCLGLIGEAGEIVDIIKKQKYMGMPDELAKEKMIDEAGDFGWYLAELCTGLGLSFEQVVIKARAWETCSDTVDEAAVDLAGMVADLYDGDDKYMRYAAERDIEDVVWCWLDLLELADVVLEDVLQHNIDKLKARYPDGFSADRSNGRYS